MTVGYRSVRFSPLILDGVTDPQVASGVRYSWKPTRAYDDGTGRVEAIWNKDPLQIEGTAATRDLPLTPGDLSWALTVRTDIFNDGRGERVSYEETVLVPNGSVINFENLQRVDPVTLGPIAAAPSALELRLQAVEAGLAGVAPTGASDLDAITDMTPFMRGVNTAADAGAARSAIGAAAASALTSLAPLASPALTGNPTAPTPTAGDNDTSVATTAFVTGAVSGLAPLASPALTGNPTAPTQTAGNNTTRVATTAFVTTAVAAVSGVDLTPYATLASPALTGNPTAPTPTAGDNDTSVATTAFVTGAVTGLAPLASPALTGSPTAPTPTAGDNDTSVATTAFVQGELADKADLNHTHLEADLPVDLGAWYIDRTDANPQPARPVLQFGRRVIAVGSSGPWDNAIQGDIIQEQRFYVPTTVFTDAAIEALATGTTITAGSPGNAGWTNTQISGGGANKASDSTVGTVSLRGTKFARLIQNNTTQAYLGYASLGALPVTSFELWFRYVGSLPAVNSTLFTAFDDASFTSTHRNLMAQVNAAGSLTILSGVGAALGLEMTCPTALGANTWYRLNLNASATDNFLWAMLDTGPDTVPIWTRSKTPGAGHAITAIDGFNMGFGNPSAATTIDIRARVGSTRGLFGVAA